MPITAGAKGRGDLIQQPDRVVFDTVRGALRYRVFKCVDNDKINVQAATCIALGLPYQITSSGTMHEIAIEIYGGTSDITQQLAPQDRWDMPPNEIQKNVFEHNKLIQFDPDIMGIALREAEAGNPFDDFIAELDASGLTADWDAISVPNQNLIEDFYSLAKRGSDHFALGQYVLKHTTTIGPRYDANVADINIEKLYTTAQLLAETTDPLLWVYPLPGRLQFKIQNIVAPPARDGYLWSWRKLVTGEGTIAGGRIETGTEYWLEQWALLDYDPVT